MKKSKKIGLSLNKNVVSNLNKNAITGGTWVTAICDGASVTCPTTAHTSICDSSVHCLTGSHCKCK